VFRPITAIMRRMYLGSSKSIHTTTLIPTTVNLLQWWTYHLWSNTIVTRYTCHSGFSIAQNTCGSQFLISAGFAASCFVLWLPRRQIFSISGRFLFREMKKIHTVESRENTEVAARVGWISCFRKSCCTTWDEWAGALSRWIRQYPDRHFSGRLLHIAWLRGHRTSK
jgi:hypothetical protein